MLKRQAAQRRPEVESEWPKITIFGGLNLAWKLYLKCNFMQKPKMYKSGVTFVETEESSENGEFYRSQPAQPGGLSPQSLGLRPKQFEKH